MNVKVAAGRSSKGVRKMNKNHDEITLFISQIILLVLVLCLGMIASCYPWLIAIVLFADLIMKGN